MNRKQKQKGYECSAYRTYGKSRCKYHEIKEADMIIHLKQFFEFTKQQYQKEINQIKIETKINNKQKTQEKVKSELENLKAEYKILLNQKIKDLTASISENQKRMIENTYKELERDKINQIETRQEILEKEEQEISKEKIRELKTAIECFDEIIASEIPNKFVLEKIIDRIWIYSDKTIKFDLKVNIEKLI